MLFKSATSRNIFAVAASGVVTTIAASAVLFSMAYSNVQQTSFEQLRGIASSSAMAIEKSVAEATKSVVMMETSLATLKESGNASREGADAFLKHALRDNPTLLGTWSVWEPNALDGRDAEFVNAEGHDASGRFIPYWTRNGDSFQRTALENFDEPGPGDSYLIPHQTQKISVIEPYNYVVSGKQVIMTSISAPIIEDGEFLGVVGLDLGLDDVRVALSEIKPMGTGFVGLVTQGGNILSHPDSSVTGKPLKDAGDAARGWAELIAQPGVERETVGADGEPHLSIAVPVKITDDQNWYAIVSVPTSTVFASLNSMAWSAAGITLVAAVLLGLCGWLISRRFVARINNVIDETDKIASGRLDIELKDTEAGDEIGHLTRSLNVLLENNKQKIQLEREAETTRAAQEAERAERARIASVQEEEAKFAVGELATGLSRLADGDMTVRLERAFTSTLDEIRLNFNNAVEKLQAAMLAFSENASTIETGSREIRSGADDLARRTEQQAASVEETAAALEEITTSVKDSTLRAEEAGALVARTKQGAERSGEVVRNAVTAMGEIERSSQSISNIIGVIDDIAFQTNLLALNAGVEAARAGEAGKGFAVVAQEVRELAQRSANAAKEIKSLITASGEQVKRGVGLVDETGHALEAIVAEVQQIDQNVQAIVQAAREQSTGLQEINTAVNQMDQGTQQNAAMVEQSNAAVHTLVTEVSALSNRLAQFNLGSRGRVAAAASAAVPVRSTAPATAPVRSAALATSSARPAPSPARALTGKLKAAFGGGGAAAAAAPAESDWEEF